MLFPEYYFKELIDIELIQENYCESAECDGITYDNCDECIFNIKNINEFKGWRNKLFREEKLKRILNE